MGIRSIGIRRVIWKGIRDVKVKHNIPLGLHDSVPGDVNPLLGSSSSPIAIDTSEQISLPNTFTGAWTQYWPEPGDTDDPTGAFLSGYVLGANAVYNNADRAKARYSYQADPNDRNEISFAKGENLTVLIASGSWWLVKKETGEKGMAPSNYVLLC